MVGIATFDSTIHFYNLKRALQQVTSSHNILSFSITFKNSFPNDKLTRVYESNYSGL